MVRRKRRNSTAEVWHSANREYCWSPNTWQGKVIQSIVLSDTSLTLPEIQKLTSLPEDSVKMAIDGLILGKQVFATEDEDKAQVTYHVYDDLRPAFLAHYSNLLEAEQKRKSLRNEFPEWIEQWKRAKDLDIEESYEHCFLERRHLDDFSKELISHASSEVLVANPFIEECDLSNTLQEAKNKGTEVQIITRPPEDKYRNQFEKKKLYLQKLQSRGIKIFYNPKVHAKLIIVDRAVAIASSMNFYPESSAGETWEAGLVTWKKTVVNSIIDSFNKSIKDEIVENFQ